MRASVKMGAMTFIEACIRHRTALGLLRLLYPVTYPYIDKVKYLKTYHRNGKSAEARIAIFIVVDI